MGKSIKNSREADKSSEKKELSQGKQVEYKWKSTFPYGYQGYLTLSCISGLTFTSRT
jgi:hypothetical protein